ncbi:MAG: hypothetical protein RL331_840 [Bacteroidota bacterium]|jgi:hypothetical protein
MIDIKELKITGNKKSHLSMAFQIAMRLGLTPILLSLSRQLLGAEPLNVR